MKEIITIFSQRLAGYLMYQGFVLGGIRQDSEGSGRNLFFFKNSNNIQDVIKKYRELHPSNKN